MNSFEKRLSSDAQIGANGAGNHNQNEGEKEIDSKTGYTVMFFDPLDSEVLFDEGENKLYVRDKEGALWEVTDYEAEKPNQLINRDTGEGAEFDVLFAGSEAESSEVTENPEGPAVEMHIVQEEFEPLPAKFTDGVEQMEHEGQTIYYTQGGEYFVLVGNEPYLVKEDQEGERTFVHYQGGEEFGEKGLKERMSDQELLAKYKKEPIAGRRDDFIKELMIFTNSDGHEFIIVDGVYYDVVEEPREDGRGTHRVFRHWKNSTEHKWSQLSGQYSIAASAGSDIYLKMTKDGRVEVAGGKEEAQLMNRALGDQDERQTF